MLLLVLLVACSEPPPEPEPGVVGRVTRITDGDTIHVDVNGTDERVRYIGIDTPETEHSPRGAERFGAEATEANRALVENREVRLVLDVQERDRYGRLLAYVYVDETFVNAELVQRGFAKQMTVPPNVRHAEELGRLEREARAARRGLWAD